MAEQIQETRERIIDDGDRVSTARRVTTTNVERDADTVVERVDHVPVSSTTARVIWYIAGVLLTLLAFRFALSLLGANRGNPFADFIYSTTYPFVAPFFGLFGYSVRYGVSRFEIETLVAMAVYALLAYGIVKLIDIGKRAG